MNYLKVKMVKKMPGQHKNLTISFRPSEWEKHLIDQRAFLSGINKKDFIIRSCIYSNIVVVGTKENIRRIVDTAQEMQNTMKELAGLIQSGEFVLSDESYRELKGDYLAFVLAMLDILDGAAYLFDKKQEKHEKDNEKIEEYRRLLNL